MSNDKPSAVDALRAAWSKWEALRLRGIQDYSTARYLELLEDAAAAVAHAGGPAMLAIAELEAEAEQLRARVATLEALLRTQADRNFRAPEDDGLED